MAASGVPPLETNESKLDVSGGFYRYDFHAVTKEIYPRKVL